MTYEIPGHFATKDHDGSFSDGKVWTFLLGYTLDYDRKIALEMYAPVDTRHRYVVKAPPGYEFDGLREQTVSSKWGTFTRQAQWLGEDARTVQVDFRLRLERVRVDPADFDVFRTFHKNVNDSYRAWLTLERVWRLEHVAELEATLALAPEDMPRRRRWPGCTCTTTAQPTPDGYCPRPFLPARRGGAVGTGGEGGRERGSGREGPARTGAPLPAGSDARHCPGRHADRPRPLGVGRAGAGGAGEDGDIGDSQSGVLPTRPQRPAAEQGGAALEHLKEAATYEGDKDNTVAIEMLRGRVCEQLGRPADARKAYEKAHRTDSKAEDALAALIELCLAQKDRTQAARYLTRYAALVDDLRVETRGCKGLLHAADAPCPGPR